MRGKRTKEISTITKAKEDVFRLLKFRLRSEKEVRDRLKLKKYSPSDIDEVVTYFKNISLIDDLVFTREWISSRQRKPYGPKRIRFELIEKGINTDILQDELRKGFEGYPQEQIVFELAEQKISHYRHLDRMTRRRRLSEYLRRRGFEALIIQKVIDKYDGQ